MIFENIRKAIKNTYKKYIVTDEDLGWNRAIYKCETIVAEVQAEYNNGWIPCSERLPENISTVLVQVKEIEKPTIGWYGNMDNKWILSERDFADLQEFTVLAWQPLPEPYTPKGE